jgi:hypothetical protein
MHGNHFKRFTKFFRSDPFSILEELTSLRIYKHFPAKTKWQISKTANVLTYSCLISLFGVNFLWSETYHISSKLPALNIFMSLVLEYTEQQ